MPVGSFAPNNWGLYDMHGNAYEWCWDWFDEDYYSYSPPNDPTGPISGDGHVARGASWGQSGARKHRSAYRCGPDPDYPEAAGMDNGFRLVRRP